MEIILYSPIRTGSTLVYNILKALFPNGQVIKDHTPHLCNEYNYTVVTIRHPIDSIISSIRRHDEAISKEALQFNLEEYLSNGGRHLLDTVNNKNIHKMLVLKYEEFYNNYGYMFDELEKCFAITIPLIRRESLKNIFSIESVDRIAKQYGTFDEYDKDTHIHGRHISNTFGRSVFKDILTEDQINELANHEIIKSIMMQFKYATAEYS